MPSLFRFDRRRWGFFLAMTSVSMERRAIIVRGIVQGVGFRPFVYNLAARLQLAGFVKNQTGSVLIEVEGETPALDHFMAELGGQPPPLAQIDDLRWEPRLTRGDSSFRIEVSDADPSSPIFISPDVATCHDCVAELFDPADRRHAYPFLNCTHCGPRLTIITGAPYDRPKTTMAGFAMCPACHVEYDDPSNRRFHAQPTACAACGPALLALDAGGRPIETGDPLGCFVSALQQGRTGALKGLGGYHLVCLAGNAAAVAELRKRKHRDEKPFAIMVADVAGAEALCAVSPAERNLLESPQCPIVLLRRRTGSKVADEVAPGNPLLGVMLPYTPLHHLLLRAVNGVPLVMTSGNRSDEPIAYRDDEAVQKLSGIADIFLVHNRPIHVRCDDSVTRVVDRQELPLRRSRGYAPRPIALPLPCAGPILAVGGQLKATFALGRDRQAFLSHHMGDLDHYDAYQAFVKDVALYRELFGIRPQLIAHDAHPDYVSTGYARQLADREGIRLLAVQHHHAHMASCMAENGLDEPVIGITFDGAGYGPDGAVWGGEFLIGDYQQFRRAAHFRYVGMPGGEQAVREPWRMAVAHLADAGAASPLLGARILPDRMRMVEQLLSRHFNTPQTSSAGRLFDAVAALCGVRDQVSYEGQAAIELEWLATGVSVDGIYPFELSQPAGETPLIIDTRPLIGAVAREVDQQVAPAVIARRFHATLTEVIAQVCGRLRDSSSINAVALSGGVFLNALLTGDVLSRLRGAGFRVYRHRLVPPNDGGLSLGQLAITARQSRSF
jgi:hydrogenase maturation protein HypF